MSKMPVEYLVELEQKGELQTAVSGENEKEARARAEKLAVDHAADGTTVVTVKRVVTIVQYATKMTKTAWTRERKGGKVDGK